MTPQVNVGDCGLGIGDWEQGYRRIAPQVPPIPTSTLTQLPNPYTLTQP